MKVIKRHSDEFNFELLETSPFTNYKKCSVVIYYDDDKVNEISMRMFNENTSNVIYFKGLNSFKDFVNKLSEIEQVL